MKLYSNSLSGQQEKAGVQCLQWSRTNSNVFFSAGEEAVNTISSPWHFFSPFLVQSLFFSFLLFFTLLFSSLISSSSFVLFCVQVRIWDVSLADAKLCEPLRAHSNKVSLFSLCSSLPIFFSSLLSLIPSISLPLRPLPRCICRPTRTTSRLAPKTIR